MLRTGLTSVVEAVDVVGETQGVGMWAIKVGDTVKKPTHDPYCRQQKITYQGKTHLGSWARRLVMTLWVAKH